MNEHGLPRPPPQPSYHHLDSLRSPSRDRRVKVSSARESF